MLWALEPKNYVRIFIVLQYIEVMFCTSGTYSPSHWNGTIDLEIYSLKNTARIELQIWVPSIYCMFGWGTVAVPEPLPLPIAALRHLGQLPHPL